jgi:hypothetical protein
MDKYLKQFKTLNIISQSDLSYGNNDYDIEFIGGLKDLFDIVEREGINKYKGYDLTSIKFENKEINVLFER